MAEGVRPPLLVEAGLGGPGGVLSAARVSRRTVGAVGAVGTRYVGAPAARVTATRTRNIAATRRAAGRERVNAFRAHHFTALRCRPADRTR
ncbi:hypothetical protein OG292_36695 [Streptomyces sp. NBC_01511]|uniref:hypothetical protein n=1 Tax=Streptomyces sp. NBC_01511 TaxID=2903889 RepID=UPI003870B5AE